MPIRPYLAGQAFSPELITEMSAALEAVCKALHLDQVDDRRTRLVASTIIQAAQRGIRDSAGLIAATLKEFKAD